MALAIILFAHLAALDRATERPCEVFASWTTSALAFTLLHEQVHASRKIQIGSHAAMLSWQENSQGDGTQKAAEGS